MYINSVKDRYIKVRDTLEAQYPSANKAIFDESTNLIAKLPVLSK